MSGPGLAKVKPHRDKTAEVVNRCATRWRMSQRDFADAIEKSKTLVVGYLAADKPIPLEILSQLPPKYALELLDELRLMVLLEQQRRLAG